MPGVAASSIRILTLVAGILVAIAGSRSEASIAHEPSDPDESDEFDRSHPGCSTVPPFQVGRGTWSELARPRDLRGGANHVRGPPAAV